METSLPPLLRKTGSLVTNQNVISIIDDDTSTRKAIRRLIESVDFTVAEFASAEDFLCSDCSQTSACLILDFQLPGMSGLELQNELRSSNPQLPIIFISATANELATTRALRSGAISFLEKPIDHDALFAAIDSCLVFSSYKDLDRLNSG
jgi:FixJ family two-component response regulator